MATQINSRPPRTKSALATTTGADGKESGSPETAQQQVEAAVSAEADKNADAADPGPAAKPARVQNGARVVNGQPQPDRGHVVHARYQWFAFAVFGGLSLLAALVFARWDPTVSDSRWFWVVVGPLAGVVAMFRSQSVFESEGADRDAGPYIGMLVGTTVGALVLGFLSLEGWVLAGVFFAVAGFLAFMAWLEQSGIGMTTALTVTVLAAATAVANVSGSSVMLSLLLGAMLLSAAAALVVCRDPNERTARRPSTS